MLKHPGEYENCRDLVSVYLRLQHSVTDDCKLMLSQAYLSRRAVLFLDGIDECGALKERIEDFIAGFLVHQRMPVCATTRRAGFSEEKFREFVQLALPPLDPTLQREAVIRRP